MCMDLTWELCIVCLNSQFLSALMVKLCLLLSGIVAGSSGVVAGSSGVVAGSSGVVAIFAIAGVVFFLVRKQR